jgi:formylglycine-generating enzyme required for sulfatase activity
MSDLAALTSARSQLTLGVEAYLRSLIDGVWAADALFLAPSTMAAAAIALGGASSVSYQSPNVFLRNSDTPADNRRKRQGDSEPSSPERTVARPWETERHRPGFIVILGSPGEGKTLLTRMTCGAVAQASLSLLHSRTCSLDEIPIPVWLRFEDLLIASTRRNHNTEWFGAAQLALDVVVPTRVALAVAHVYQSCPETAPDPALASEFLRHVLNRASTWLFVDALDELGHSGRTLDRKQVLAFLSELPEGAHVIMTCRKHEYSRGRVLPNGIPAERLREYDLAPLDPRQQHAIVNWYLGPGTEKCRDVLMLLSSDARFRDMASNGLMLTLICAARERHAIGPNTRSVQLYDLILRDVVSRARRGNALSETDPEIEYRLDILRELAWDFFIDSPGSFAIEAAKWRRRLIAECQALQIVAPTFETDLIREGLLVPEPGGRLRFFHPSFFEYLVGARIALQEHEPVVDRTARAIIEHAGDEAWQRPLVYAVGQLGLIRGGQGEPSLAADVVDGVLARAAAPSASAVAALIGAAIADAWPAVIPASRAGTLRKVLTSTMRDSLSPPKVRSTAGNALGRIGDARFHDPDLWCLPDDRACGFDVDNLGFIRVPQGSVLLGSSRVDSGGKSKQRPRHRVTLPEYYIGRWPVTAAQFRSFVIDTRYVPSSADSLVGVDNHPVVNVSPADVLSYGMWLTVRLWERVEAEDSARARDRSIQEELAAKIRTGWSVVPPSEPEWEKAVRWKRPTRPWRRATLSNYPWGDEFDPNRANTRQSDIRATTPVGCFPGSASALGVEDAVGNVWEYTRSSYRPYPYDWTDGREELDFDNPGLNSGWVVRGGSFHNDDVRAALREYFPGLSPRDGSLGFRVAIVPYSARALSRRELRR